MVGVIGKLTQSLITLNNNPFLCVTSTGTGADSVKYNRLQLDFRTIAMLVRVNVEYKQYFTLNVKVNCHTQFHLSSATFSITFVLKLRVKYDISKVTNQSPVYHEGTQFISTLILTRLAALL